METYTWNVVWDQDGTAYLGRDYLWRWDGQAFEKIGEESFLALRGMAMGPDGKLWLAGINQFGAYDPNSNRFQSHMDWIPEEYRQFGEAWMLHHDGESIWLGSRDRLFCLTQMKARVWEFGNQHRVIFHFLPSGIYAHETDVGLWKIQDGGKRLLTSDTELASRSILFLEDSGEGTLKGISGNGIFRIEPNQIVRRTSLPIEFFNVQISAIRRIEDKYLAIGTLGKGVLILDELKMQAFEISTLNDSRDNLIVNLSMDPYGNLFSSGFGVGLVRLSIPAGMVKFQQSDCLGYPRSLNYNSGVCGIASEGGWFQFKIHKSKRACNYILENLVGGELAKSSAWGKGFIFDRYSKLYYVEGEEPELLHEFAAAIKNFSVSGNNLIYIAFASELGVYRIEEDHELRQLGLVESENNLQKMGIDGNGHLWGWSPRTPLVEAWLDEDGVLRIRRHREAAGHSLLEPNYRLAVVCGGPVLIFRDKLLWYRRETGLWDSMKLSEPLSLTEAYAFEESGGEIQGWLIDWDPSFRYYKVHEVRWKESAAIRQSVLPWPDMRSLGRITRILPVNHPDIRFIIGGTDGLMLAGPRLQDTIGELKKPTIYSGADRLFGEPPRRYQYGKDLVNFHFRSADSGEHYPIKYQTRLKGNERWSDPATMDSRSIGQLAAGDYCFEVRAVDPFQRASPSAEVCFTVLPPWYGSRLAWGGYAAFTLMGSFLMVRISVRRLRARQQVLESLVEERTADLVKVGAFKDELIANLSHEIRNPLNGIIGLIRQMKEGVVLPKNHLKALRGAASYLHATVEGVLDFSRIEAGIVRFEKAPVDVHEISSGVLEIYREQAVGKGLKFTSEIDLPEGTGVLSDARKLQQIIGNLTGNAVKFTSSGGVHVELFLRETSECRSVLHLSVIDTGTGIPSGDLERIFDKFVRLEQGGMRKDGTGIGLALVKTYADRMGAKLVVESQENEGSTFTLDIPVELCSLDLEKADPDEITVLEKSLRVLVVEDVEYNRIFLEDFLSGSGCHVESADRGDTGLEMGLTGNYDVILLDWELPGMNGMEIAENLRASGNLQAHTRIFALTAYATSDMEQKCLESGMDAFLTKPVNEAHLLNLLRVGDLESMTEADPCQTAEAAIGKMEEGIIIGRGKLGGMGDWEASRQRFMSYWKAYFSELSKAVESGEPEDIRQSAHKFLGLIQMIELRHLPDTLRSIQDAARAEDLHMIKAHWASFNAYLPQFHDEWDRL